MSSKRICKIGQKAKCNSEGCQWKKVFKRDCWALQQKEKRESAELKITAITSEKTKGHFVKEEKKYTEVNKPSIPKKKKKKKKKQQKVYAPPPKKNSDDELFSRIGIAEPDDLFKKIKII